MRFCGVSGSVAKTAAHVEREKGGLAEGEYKRRKGAGCGRARGNRAEGGRTVKRAGGRSQKKVKYGNKDCHLRLERMGSVSRCEIGHNKFWLLLFVWLTFAF